MTRWATPSGRTVKSVILSGTPNPTRPGDPAQHAGPREYLQVTADRTRWHAASFAELDELAGREGWSLLELTEIPSHVVIDTRDGRIFHRGGDGEVFDLMGAAQFAAEGNAASETGRSHRVYHLADVTDQVLDDPGEEAS